MGGIHELDEIFVLLWGCNLAVTFEEVFGRIFTWESVAPLSAGRLCLKDFNAEDFLGSRSGQADQSAG
jgi:hypothetical protein